MHPSSLRHRPPSLQRRRLVVCSVLLVLVLLCLFPTSFSAEPARPQQQRQHSVHTRLPPEQRSSSPSRSPSPSPSPASERPAQPSPSHPSAPSTTATHPPDAHAIPLAHLHDDAAPPPSAASATGPAASSPPSSRVPVQVEIDAQGSVHGLDLESLRQGVEDAQQQLRQADIEQRQRIAAELRRAPPSAETATATGSSGAPPAGDQFVEAGQRPIDPVQAQSHAHASQSHPAPASHHNEAASTDPPSPQSQSTPSSAWFDLDGDEDDEEDDEEGYVAFLAAEDSIDELFSQASNLLSDPDASSSDTAQAMQLMQQAAQLGSSDAHTELGMAYLYGDLLPRNLSLAHEHFLAAAEDGNPSAQHSLAFLYSLSLYPSQNTVAQSVLYDYFAAAAGHVGAKLSMGYRHLHGYGVPKSCESAASYYRDVAQEVVDETASQSLNQLAIIDRAHLSDESARMSHMEDSADVLQYYQHSAEGGNVEAQLTLGQLHYYGHRGLPQSPELAAKYFSAAAAAGDANAMTSLGQMHLNGMIASDEGEDANQTALSLFQAAADQGNAAAQTSLGLLYLTGEIVPVNYTLAYNYFFQAMKQRHPEAAFRLGVMHFTGLGIQPDMTQAYVYFFSSALAGHVRALFNVGQMESFGLGVAKDCRAGVDKLKAVAERGEWSESLNEAHELFLQGDYEQSWMVYAMNGYEGQEVGQANAAWLIDQSYVSLWSTSKTDVAYGLFKQSAEQKHWTGWVNYDSYRIMGDYIYYNLTSSPHPLSLAVHHYTKASDKNAQASWDLGYMYHHGLGVAQDYHLAKRYYDHAMVVDGNAYVASKLAVVGLWWDGWMEGWREWWENRSNQPEDADVKDKPNQKVADAQDQESADDGVVGLVGGMVRRVFGAESAGWGWMEWYEAAENVVLALASVALAVCVYYRAQRM